MEIWDGYLSDGTLAGVDLVRGEPIPEGLHHLVSEVLVRHVDGDYLLVKRDERKPNWGGYFEATAGGSAVKGEDAYSCAIRELFEETGIEARFCDEIGVYVSKNTIYHNYLCVTDCDKEKILLQDGETVEYVWLNEKEFVEFLNSDKIIPTQKLHYMNYFKKMGYIREKPMKNNWKEISLARKIISIISILLSLAAIALVILQFSNVLPQGSNIHLLCLGLANLCLAFSNWRTNRFGAYLELGVGIFIIACYIIIFLV